MRTNVGPESGAGESNARRFASTDGQPSASSPGGTGRAVSRSLGGSTVRVLKRLWKRHVRGQPDEYRAYVSLPTGDGQPSFGEVHDCIERLEYVFEGRVDVYARVRGMAVVTDPVPADRFDRDAFDAALESLEDCYAETHSLTRLEKWRPADDGLVKSFVVVPVKPLFPRERTDVDQDEDGEPRVRSPAE